MTSNIISPYPLCAPLVLLWRDCKPTLAGLWHIAEETDYNQARKQLSADMDYLRSGGSVPVDGAIATWRFTRSLLVEDDCQCEIVRDRHTGEERDARTLEGAYRLMRAWEQEAIDSRDPVFCDGLWYVAGERFLTLAEAREWLDYLENMKC